jgi:hypothetical protein
MIEIHPLVETEENSVSKSDISSLSSRAIIEGVVSFLSLISLMNFPFQKGTNPAFFTIISDRFLEPCGPLPV